MRIFLQVFFSLRFSTVSFCFSQYSSKYSPYLKPQCWSFTRRSEVFRVLGTLSLQLTLCGWPSVCAQSHWGQPRCSSSLKVMVWLWPHVENCQQNDFVSLLFSNKSLFALWVFIRKHYHQYYFLNLESTCISLILSWREYDLLSGKIAEMGNSTGIYQSAMYSQAQTGPDRNSLMPAFTGK